MTLIDTIKAGGAERLAMQIATRLDPARFQTALCVSRWDWREESDGTEKLLSEFREAGGAVLPLHRNTRVDLWQWAPLIRALRGQHVDVLHSHVFTSNAWGAAIGRLARVPVVIGHEHTWSFEGQPLRRFVDREVVARFSDAFVACSREDMRRMIEIEGISPDKLHLILNGIEAPPPRRPADVRGPLGIAPDAPVLLAVGRLVPNKGFDVLIRAAARLQPDFPDLKVLIAGDGDHRPQLQGLIDEAGLDDQVKLLGVRPDVPDLLAGADLAVGSSRVEGSPLAVLEQMQAGKPIVATAVGGVPDLIEDGVHGRLVASEDDEALAAAIAELLNDRGRAAAMGAAAHERWAAEFELAAMVGRVEALYLELAARAGVVA
jgi:glycosyltransferase involved in cell wall biosynthesis